MDARTKVFRAHRALSWWYAGFGALVSAAVLVSTPPQHRATALVVPALFALLASAHHFTARACRTGSAAGRRASIVIACLMLAGFPIGTLIGVYLLAHSRKPWPPSTPSAAFVPGA